MKNSSKKNFTIIILFLSVLMISMMGVTASEASTPQVYITDDGIEVETKFKKVSTNKITFNANGGTIGKKKSVAMNVRKGAKINKFPTTPKRDGYTFKGWYTKKTGGKKIAVSTKPTKSITLYAQWTKKASSRVLTAEEKKLVGAWEYGDLFHVDTIIFKNDGSFDYWLRQGSSPSYIEQRIIGKYQLKNDKIQLTNRLSTRHSVTGKTYYKNQFGKVDDFIRGYKWCTNPNHGNCLLFDPVLSSWDTHYKRLKTVPTFPKIY